MKIISPTTIESIIAYGLVALKDNNFLGQILEKVLFHMYDDLNTKMYLKEILTGKFLLENLENIRICNYSFLFDSVKLYFILVFPFDFHGFLSSDAVHRG